MKFRPLHDRVVVRRAEGELKSKGGIIIPDTAKEKPQEGEIVAVGPGARDDAGKLIALDVKVGDAILFGKWSGTEVKLDGEDLLIMKEADIMGIVETAASESEAKPQDQGEEGRLSATSATHTDKERDRKPCLPRKSNSERMPATTCCAASKSSPTR